MEVVTRVTGSSSGLQQLQQPLPVATTQASLLEQQSGSLGRTIPLFCDAVACFAEEAQAITKR